MNYKKPAQIIMMNTGFTRFIKFYATILRPVKAPGRYGKALPGGLLRGDRFASVRYKNMADQGGNKKSRKIRKKRTRKYKRNNNKRKQKKTRKSKS